MRVFPGPRAYAWRLAAAVAAAVAVLPFLRGIAAGHVLYFRDLGVLFHPFRHYVVEGLRAGELRYWDPFVHEGVPLLYPPLAYPIDLLQALWADPRWISLLLALHVPLAAATFVVLARSFGVSPRAAAGGAIVYALGGYVLSTVNIYIHLQAAAWAPLVVVALRAARRGRGPAVAAAALAIAVSLSTLGVEIALQAVPIGLVLAVRRRRLTALAGPVAGVLLGFGLAAPVVLVMRANMAAGERAHGFPVEVVLNQSIHPFTLVQVLVADLYGDLSRLPDEWWGSSFFDRGFPFILSLYLGATVVALVFAALGVDRRRTPRLALLALLALWVTLGRWSGLGSVLAVVPDSWRAFRYPTKVFFTVHLCLALLAAIGLHHLERRRGWRVVLGAALGLGLPLAALPLAPRLAPGAAGWFVARFFPPVMDAATRAAHFAFLLADGARGGLLALCAALVALVTLAGRVTPRRGATLLAMIVAGDLLRAGAGLNPMADPRFLRTSPEVLAALDALPGRQRVFSCHPETSRAYWEARRERPQDHEALTLSAWTDLLVPHFNRTAHVPSALSEDLTSLVPVSRLLPTRGCGDLGAALPPLRASGVSHVLSLDPLDAPGFTLVAEVRPARLAPLHVFVYTVPGPVPLRFVASSVRSGDPPPGAVPSPERAWVAAAPAEVDGASGAVRSVREEAERIELEVEASRPTALVVLDGWGRGWSAAIDGTNVPLLRAGEHRAVWVPPGRSHVTLAYHPPGLRAGVAVLAASGLAVIVLWRGGWRRRSRASAVHDPARPSS